MLTANPRYVFHCLVTDEFTLCLSLSGPSVFAFSPGIQSVYNLMLGTYLKSLEFDLCLIHTPPLFITSALNIYINICILMKCAWSLY